MGKCSKCGKKIEYNNYKVIDGIVYCPNCIPKKEAKAIATTLMKTVVDSKVKFDKFEKAMDEASEALTEDTPKQERKPRKRSKKND